MLIKNKRDLSSEIKFWNTVFIEKNRPPWMNNLINPDDRIKEFPNKFHDIINKFKKKPIKVLDVGCGPLSPLAWGVDNKFLEVTAIDPLAHEYNKLLKKHKINYSIKPIKCAGEEILKFFDREEFDIVYSRNALDHSQSPKTCVDNIFYVLKSGGFFFHEGFVNEGTRSNWGGLHQHNLISENKKLVCYDKDNNKVDLTKGYELKCIFEEFHYDVWFRIIYKKIK